MVILQGDKSHRVALLLLHAMRLKIPGSDLICKVASKCLNIHEWVEVVERNKRWSSLFPYCPMNRQW